MSVPDSEAIERALRRFYSSNHAPDIERLKFKLLLKLAMTIVHFKYKNKWYSQQTDGLVKPKNFIHECA